MSVGAGRASCAEGEHPAELHMARKQEERSMDRVSWQEVPVIVVHFSIRGERRYPSDWQCTLNHRLMQAVWLFEGDWMGDEINTVIKNEVANINIELGTGIQKTDFGALREKCVPRLIFTSNIFSLHRDK